MKERVARAREARFPGLKTAKKHKKNTKKKIALTRQKKAKKKSRLRTEKKITCLAQRR